MAGLFALVKSDWYTISQGPRGDIVMYFLTATCALPEASKFAFEITMFLLQDTSQKGAINSENFGDFVDLLISFTAESTGVLHNMADRQIYQQISSTVLYDTDQVPSAGGAVASPNRPDGSAIPAKGGRR